jgi:methyltransferase
VTAAAVIVLAFLLAEAWRANRNERAQRARGGREPAGDVYALMSVAYPAAFAAMFAEGFVRGAPPAPVVAAGALLFAASKALKWWAILSLGPAWTFRIIVVPGMRLVTSGPYRLIRHPNYAAVVGELASVALMTGARLSGPLATTIFTALIIRRMSVERRALAELIAP